MGRRRKTINDEWLDKTAALSLEQAAIADRFFVRRLLELVAVPNIEIRRAMDGAIEEAKFQTEVRK